MGIYLCMDRLRVATGLCIAAGLFGACGTAHADDGLPVAPDPRAVADTAAAIAGQAAGAADPGQYQPDTGQYQGPGGNINVSVRVLSPGDDGAVDQAISVAQPAPDTAAPASPVTISVNVNVTTNWTVVFPSQSDTGQYHMPDNWSQDLADITAPISANAAPPAPAPEQPPAPTRRPVRARRRRRPRRPRATAGAARLPRRARSQRPPPCLPHSEGHTPPAGRGADIAAPRARAGPAATSSPPPPPPAWPAARAVARTPLRRAVEERGRGRPGRRRLLRGRPRPSSTRARPRPAAHRFPTSSRPSACWWRRCGSPRSALPAGSVTRPPPPGHRGAATGQARVALEVSPIPPGRRPGTFRRLQRRRHETHVLRAPRRTARRGRVGHGGVGRPHPGPGPARGPRPRRQGSWRRTSRAPARPRPPRRSRRRTPTSTSGCSAPARTGRSRRRNSSTAIGAGRQRQPDRSADRPGRLRRPAGRAGRGQRAGRRGSGRVRADQAAEHERRRARPEPGRQRPGLAGQHVDGRPQSPPT